MNDEKYVSIEYDKWHNHYLKQDEIIEELVQKNYRLKNFKEDEAFKWVKDYADKNQNQTSGYIPVIVDAGYRQMINGYVHVNNIHVPWIDKEVERRVNKIPKWIRKIFGV